ncbi:3'-5' exonuclease Snipper-like protein [Drosera capensis]
MSTSKIPTALQHRETMQKGHEAFGECLQNNGFSYSPQCYKNSKGQSLEPKRTSEFNQGTGGKEQDGAASGKSMHIRPIESGLLPVQQQNYYFCSGYQTNFTKEMPNQAHLIQNHIYAPNNEHYFPAHNRLPYVPLQSRSPSYQQDYNFQDFQYFVVIDFEATCDKEKNPHPQEIIEFPSVLVNSSTGQLEASFQKYVRPTHNQMLSDFCKELTGIQQSQVDKGVLLSEALLMHDKWLEEKGIKHTNFAVVTWSNWDCRVMLQSECRFKRIRKPPYFNRWINLKVPFLEVFGRTKCNLKEAVQLAGLTWEGRAHCGLDDAKNTARLLTLLMRRGFRLSITNSLFWQATDYPYTIQPDAAPAEWSPQKWKSPPFYTLVPFQTVQATAMKEELTYCYCGVASIKRIIRRPGPKQGSFFFGCGNWTATRGAQCPYFKWASTADGPKSI